MKFTEILNIGAMAMAATLLVGLLMLAIAHLTAPVDTVLQYGVPDCSGAFC